MPFTDEGGDFLYQDILHLEFDVYYIVRSTWLGELQNMIAEERDYQMRLVSWRESHEDEGPEVPF